MLAYHYSYKRRVLSKPLYVKCKICGFEFPTGIAMDQKGFAASSLIGNYHACPRCGATSQYNKEDYFFK